MSKTYRLSKTAEEIDNILKQAILSDGTNLSEDAIDIIKQSLFNIDADDTPIYNGEVTINLNPDTTYYEGETTII